LSRATQRPARLARYKRCKTFSSAADSETLRDAVAQAGGQPEAMNAPCTAEEVLHAIAPLR